uniref:Uncharacterized protein n=1 Tax=viral metagenome TaxID=1070528 RepID=A0A6M3LQ75_9ZZZZ
MKFNETNKVIIETMNTEEAKAFVKFLKSEIARHQMDIDNARDLIYDVCFRYRIADVLGDE